MHYTYTYNCFMSFCYFVEKKMIFQWCVRYSSIQLERRLRDVGMFDSSYMASDYEKAGDFPDLADQRFMKAAKKYTCDADCETKSEQIRNIMRKKGQNIPSKEETNKVLASSNINNVPYKAPWCTWNNVVPNPQMWFQTPIQQKPQEPVWQPEESWWKRDYNGYAPWPKDQTYQSSYYGRRRIRSTRSQSSDLTAESDGFVGKTYVINCHGAGTEDKNGMQRLCGSCRAVRELPSQYFPTILNEVICTNSNCFKGHGQCTQKYLPMKILQNIGTSSCQYWIPVQIDIRTCCDCQVNQNSGIFQFLA